MADEKQPTEIKDEALDDAQGGAETVHLYLKANGSDVKGEVVQNAGLRSDGELVQAKVDAGRKTLKS
ncbi:MAG: hypothetical protein AAGC81_09755 [Pseudomonadota bacterium]